MQAVGELHGALICSLCKNVFDNPHTFNTCGHSFCYDCVIAKIEGIGITTSNCPTCNLPGWKKDLTSNHRLGNAVEHLKAIQKLLAPEGGVALPLPSLAAAAASPRGAAADERPPSPPLQPGNEPVEEEGEEATEGKEEKKHQQEKAAAVPVLDFGAADFGEAWRAAQLSHGPPKTPEEMQALRDEIELLEAALQLCDTLPCKPGAVAAPPPTTAGETQSQGSKPPRKLSALAPPPLKDAKAAATAAAAHSSGASERVPAAGKRAPGGASAGAAEGRTAKRHRTEARIAQMEAAAEAALRSDPKPAPTAEEREKENAGARSRAPAGHSRGRGKTPQPQPLAPAGAGTGAAPQPQPPLPLHLAVIPDSQGFEDIDLIIGDVPPAAPLDTQGAAEVRGGVTSGAAATPGAPGFLMASQVVIGADEPKQPGLEPRSVPHHPQHTQPFGISYPAPAPAPRSRSRSVSPALYSGGPPTSGYRPKPHYSQGSGSAGRSGGPARPSHGGDIRKFATTQSAAAAMAEAGDRLRPVVLCLETCGGGSQGAEALAAARDAAKRLAASLPGFTLCDEVTTDTTHVVVATDDHRVALRRSGAFLKGLAVGAWVLGPAWVESCAQAGSLVDEKCFEVQGCLKNKSKTSSVGVPERSRKKVKNTGRLFSGRKVVLERFTKGSEKLEKLVRALLELGGASVQEKGPRPKETLTVTDDPFLVEGLMARGITAVMEAQWVLESVAEGALAPKKDFQPGGKHWE